MDQRCSLSPVYEIMFESPERTPRSSQGKAGRPGRPGSPFGGMAGPERAVSPAEHAGPRCYTLTGPCALMICWKAVGGSLLLQKPYDPEQIVQAVRQVTGNRSA